MVIFNIVTIFPNFFSDFLTTSIVKQAIKKKKLQVNVVDLRKFAINKYKQIDEFAFSGGGMVLMVEPIFKALKFIKSKNKNQLLLSTDPKGKKLTQNLLTKLLKQTKTKEITILCGHYEGFDYRVNNFIDEKISIGDYILSSGEIAATVIIDGITRLIPNLINKNSLVSESFNKNKLLDFPVYTKPKNFQNYKVPPILYSGNHKLIKLWQELKSLEETWFLKKSLINIKKITKNQVQYINILKFFKANKYYEKN